MLGAFEFNQICKKYKKKFSALICWEFQIPEHPHLLLQNIFLFPRHSELVSILLLFIFVTITSTVLINMNKYIEPSALVYSSSHIYTIALFLLHTFENNNKKNERNFIQ